MLLKNVKEVIVIHQLFLGKKKFFFHLLTLRLFKSNHLEKCRKPKRSRAPLTTIVVLLRAVEVNGSPDVFSYKRSSKDLHLCSVDSNP